MRGGDPAGGLFAVMPCPAPEKPIRRVELGRILLRNDCRSVRTHLAQDRVDEASQLMGAARRFRLLDGEADRGVRGHVHEGELCRARDQDEPRLEGLGGQRLVQEAGEQVLDLAEPAQRGCGDGVREGPVAGFEAGECGFRTRGGEGVVERLPFAQHRAQEIGRELPRQEAGVFRLHLFGLRFQGSFTCVLCRD